MFKIFRKKKAPEAPTADELERAAQELGLSAQDLRLTVQKELKRIRKFILKSGGSEKICYDYWKFLENHKLYQDWRIVAEEDAPHSKLVAILSALDLLNSWKKTTDVDKTIKDIMELLSKRVYISAHLSFNHEELAELYRESGGIIGQITLDPSKAPLIEVDIRKKIVEKITKAESGWLHWKENGFDLFEAIQILQGNNMGLG